MDFLPKNPVFDDTLYTEQMDGVLSDISRTCRAVLKAPQRKFERERFVNAIYEAYDLIGGVPRLALWADKNETEFYRIMAKTIPQASMLDIVGKIKHQILPALPPSALDGDYTDVTPENPDGN